MRKIFEKNSNIFFEVNKEKPRKTKIVSELVGINFEKTVTFEKYSILRKLTKFGVRNINFGISSQYFRYQNRFMQGLRYIFLSKCTYLENLYLCESSVFLNENSEF